MYFFGCKRRNNTVYGPYLHMAINEEQLRTVTNVDLRADCPAIYDQGYLNSCVANAVAFCIHFIQIKYQMAHQFIPSRLFIYYNIRVIEDSVPYDDGAYLHDAITAINDQGGCPETLWPYVTTDYAVQPNTAAYISGYSHLSAVSRQVEVELNQMKQCLIGGYPFTFGIILYQSFYDISSDGLVSMPASGESFIGGHAMVCVGFDDTLQHFIVCNSWGSNWGDHGVLYTI